MTLAEEIVDAANLATNTCLSAREREAQAAAVQVFIDRFVDVRIEQLKFSSYVLAAGRALADEHKCLLESYYQTHRNPEPWKDSAAWCAWEELTK